MVVSNDNIRIYHQSDTSHSHSIYSGTNEYIHTYIHTYIGKFESNLNNSKQKTRHEKEPNYHRDGAGGAYHMRDLSNITILLLI